MSGVGFAGLTDKQKNRCLQNQSFTAERINF